MESQEVLYEECHARIRTTDVRVAFEYLCAFGDRLPGYTCFLQRQGYFIAYRYRQAELWPFGFIVNRRSLLFYFREPGLSNPAANLEALRREFADVSPNNAGEIKVRIRTEAEARRLMRSVFGHA